MNIGYIHTNNRSESSFCYQEKTLLNLHCERILFDEGQHLNGLYQAIESCHPDDHFFCLPLDVMIASPAMREKIHHILKTKRINVTTII